MASRIQGQVSSAHLRRSAISGVIREEPNEEEEPAVPPPPSYQRRRGISRRSSLFAVKMKNVDPDLNGTFTITQTADPSDYMNQQDVILMRREIEDKLADSKNDIGCNECAKLQDTPAKQCFEARSATAPKSVGRPTTILGPNIGRTRPRQKKGNEIPQKRVSFPSTGNHAKSLLQRPRTANTFDQWAKQMERTQVQKLKPDTAQRPVSAMASLPQGSRETYMHSNFVKIPLRRQNQPIVYDVPKNTKKHVRVKKQPSRSGQRIEIGRVLDRSVRLDVRVKVQPVGMCVTEKANRLEATPTRGAFHDTFTSNNSPTRNFSADTFMRNVVDDCGPIDEEGSVVQGEVVDDEEHLPGEDVEHEMMFCTKKKQIQSIPKLSLRMQDCLSLVDLMRYTRMRLETQMVTS